MLKGIILVFVNLIRLLMFVASTVTLSKGIQKLKRNSPLQIFNILTIASLIDSLIYLIDYVILKNISHYWSISPIAQSVYLFIEYSVFTFFYLIYLKNNLLKKFISIQYLFFFLGTFTSILLGENPFTTHYTFFTILELILINVSSIYIFKNLINAKDSIIKKHIYLICKGNFIFINITTPYYLISNFLDSKYGNEKIDPNNLTIIEALNSINDIGYIILFYFIYMAFKWTGNK